MGPLVGYEENDVFCVLLARRDFCQAKRNFSNAKMSAWVKIKFRLISLVCDLKEEQRMRGLASGL
jgi:hypothetical protein